MGASFKELDTTVQSLAVLWIRIGFNMDPDLAFYLNADPDPGQI